MLVPEPGRQALLKQLHEGHSGICHMKSLARMYMWWPGMDKQSEEFVKNCEECQVNQSNPATVRPTSWSWPRKLWSRLHLDYAGPIENKTFLILVDSHTKWMEIFPTKTATLTATITKLRWTFARYGVSQTIVTDNGTCFTSEEFESFLKSLGIQHITTAPYHPQSNGMAERCVQIKKNMKKITSGTVDERLSSILFMCCMTPQSPLQEKLLQSSCSVNAFEQSLIFYS